MKIYNLLEIPMLNKRDQFLYYKFKHERTNRFEQKI